MSEVGIKELRSVGGFISKYRHYVKRYGIRNRSLQERTRGICVEKI